MFLTSPLLRSTRPSQEDPTAVPKAHQRGLGISKVDPKRSNQTTGVLDMSGYFNNTGLTPLHLPRWARSPSLHPAHRL